MKESRVVIFVLSLLSTTLLTVIGYASPLNQFFNVRGQAGNTTLTPIATVLKGTSVPVCGTQIVNGETWLNLCGGGSVALSVAKFSTVTPAPSATATPRATSTVQPTRIITNTPLAASYIATVNAQFSREICWKERNDPPTSRGTCFLVPLDAVISDTVKQIQP